MDNNKNIPGYEVVKLQHGHSVWQCGSFAVIEPDFLWYLNVVI